MKSLRSRLASGRGQVEYAATRQEKTRSKDERTRLQKAKQESAVSNSPKRSVEKRSVRSGASGNQKASRSGAPGAKRHEASRNGAPETERQEKAPILILQQSRIKWEGKEGSGVWSRQPTGPPPMTAFDLHPRVAVIGPPVFRATWTPCQFQPQDHEIYLQLLIPLTRLLAVSTTTYSCY